MTLAMQRLASLALLLATWQAAALLAASRLLPGPAAVAERLVAQCLSGDLPLALAITLARVAAGFVLAMAIGTVIGIAMGRSRGLDRLFDSWLIFFLNLPALVVIILAYLWCGLVEAAAILAVAVNKIPNVAVTMREGARALSRDLDEMAQVFALPAADRMRHVVLPQLAPFFFAAARSGLSLIWKIVLVVELLGRGNGVGFELQMRFQMFDVAGLLAYALAFVAVVQAIEWCLLQPLEKRHGRWRR